jgi:DNA-binding transcriptional LysR family regulator
MADPVSRTEELRALCEVAAVGSFTAAAAALGTTTSSVSKQVRALETSLGVRLLNRTTRRVSLTEVGEEFYDRAREVLDRLADAEASAGALQEAPSGRLRVTIPMDFGRVHMVSTLGRFAERYPDVSLEIDLTDRHVDIVEERMDLGVRIGTLADSALVARRLGPSRMALVASPEYLARKGEPTSPRDLLKHDCIAYTLKATRAWDFVDGPVSVNARHRVNNGEVIRGLALAGCGVAMLPTFIVGEDIRAGRLTLLMDERVVSNQSIYAVYPHRRSVTAKVKAFVDQLSEYCGPVPAWDRGLPPKD